MNLSQQWMCMAVAYRQTSSSTWLTWSEGRYLSLHSSDEQIELSQFYDDSTIKMFK